MLGSNSPGQRTPIKLIALDLDGTLLDPEHTISGANRAAVRACLAAGAEVMLASGRSFGSMRPYAAALQLRQVICLNGAAGGDVVDDTVRPRRLLSWDKVTRVSDLLVRRRIPFCLFDLRGIVALPGWAVPDTLVAYGEPPIREVPELTEEYAPHPAKLLAFCEPGPLDDELRAATEGTVEQVRTHQHFLEWVAPGVSKGAALADLMAERSLDPEQVLSIGDSQNDVSMSRSTTLTRAAVARPGADCPGRPGSDEAKRPTVGAAGADKPGVAEAGRCGHATGGACQRAASDPCLQWLRWPRRAARGLKSRSSEYAGRCGRRGGER